jgi:hypothetical protein
MSEILCPDNDTMASFYDNLDVEHKWPQETYIDWYTGLPLENNYNPDDSYHTHCSAFVASVCCRLNVPILCPPKHRTEGLANAQHDWFFTDGNKLGWIQLESSINAQIEANHNNLVIMCHKNKENPNGGHIACVRPYATTTDLILLNGPRICQSGVINSSSVNSYDMFLDHDCIYWMYKL